MRATQFRQWSTQVLREFAIKGYVLHKKRMENGAFLDEDYFERLLEEIREIRPAQDPYDHGRKGQALDAFLEFAERTPGKE